MITTRPALPAAFSVFVLNQLAGRLRHELRALARAPFQEQQALAEDEAVEQERLRVGFLGLQSGGAIELPDIFQPRAHCRIASSIAIASVFIRSEYRRISARSRSRAVTPSRLVCASIAAMRPA